MSTLTRIVPWCHQLLSEVLRPGDLAVDLTAGQGRDTLLLAGAVGVSGQVIAFDVQQPALEQTAFSLKNEGYAVTNWEREGEIPPVPGIYLVQACHSSLRSYVTMPVRAAVANLGWLPGGDPGLITLPETTRRALQGTLELLCSGGRLAVVIYPGHPGGADEAAGVERLLSALPAGQWQVLRIGVANVAEAPGLLVVERK